ncbi:hypothetical protein BN1184_AZ_02060 [Pantoea ananatis]|nr:hypothetical protein BN1182_BH_01150 [Pantoea ananatis]CRH34056.1 hypothetical protein BN1183_AZ_00100 [Pantoea ananatis]CRH38573.1 hypothetical protein BN1184_AZ_02060 [Pantoea ananatis]
MLVNKRLAVKLQKPYQASSGIVSIVATGQSTRQELLGPQPLALSGKRRALLNPSPNI